MSKTRAWLTVIGVWLAAALIIYRLDGRAGGLAILAFPFVFLGIMWLSGQLIKAMDVILTFNAGDSSNEHERTR